MNSQGADSLGENAESGGSWRALKRLRRKILRLTPPTNYWAGVCTHECVVPDNIQLFHRLEALKEPPASHHRFVLIVNLMTAATVVLDQTPFVLEPAHALLIFPYQFHWYTDFASRSIRWLFTTFESDQRQALGSLKDSPVPLSAAALAHVGALCDAYPGHGRKHDPMGNAVALTLGLLLDELRRAAAAGPTSGAARPASTEGQEMAERISGILEEHFAQSVSIVSVARQLGISPSHLRNVFREQFGTSLGKYLRRLRLHKAIRLMATTPLTLSEIADRCGYDSLYSFSRTFKTEYGEAPRAYRRRLAPSPPAASGRGGRR